MFSNISFISPKMKQKQYSILVILIISISGCTNNKSWKALFNGKDLAGWDTYIGPLYDTSARKFDTIPVGFNNDPDNVFSVVKLGDEKVIRISGKDFGGISTKEEFENYQLQLQFRWGEMKSEPKKKEKMDSGLMYHSVGPNGADGGFWMRSHEFQIEEGNCGDYWACAGAVADVNVKKRDSSDYVFDRSGELLSFSTVSKTGRHCIKMPDAEKPTGEWNTLDLYCFGNTSIHVVNGVAVMVLLNSRQTENNKEIPLTKGKIQIQSEGAEVYYRNIRIRPIEKLPDLR